ncbi:hypothetical protein J132_09927 [Termitomyces sp. J132]|nr:hypothetical protein C0989_003216 [Termitomyces sp. Mn162]KAH0589290.1 hypothetical protein H2248_005052 [Termitomyces sp. 'cryptogamus']KNZ78789.1 hypothetical protein J132_09927 [Termitomyces sp. J132]
MDHVNVPDLLAPGLSYLSDTLPPPLYSFAINALSHILALCSATVNLISFLISRNPLEWDLQTLLPPLITLFAAYFALLSFYRTTTWMLRTSLFFIKWGTLFGILIAGTAWFMGNESSLGRYSGVVSTLGSFILNVMSGQGQKSTRYSRSDSRTQGSEKRKPKAWDSFERHREWQYDQTQQDGAAADAQKVIDDIIGRAGKFARENGWWSVVKGIVEGISETGRSSDGQTAKQSSHDSQSTTKAHRSRSR